MVAIVTDSSTLYSPEQAQEAGFSSVPLCINIGDWNERDLVLDMDRYYQMIGEGQIPRSSQPPIGDVMDTYESLADSEIINIAMADGLSGTYQTACCARNLVENKDRITVFNTRTLCGPHRYLVEMAQCLKQEGFTAGEILDWLKRASEKTESFLIPQDFSYLKRGGRLTPLAAATGSVLNLKPVMRLTDDGKKLDRFAIKRTMSSAADAVIQYLKKKGLGKDHILYISHARAQADAQKIRAMFEAAFEGLEIRMLELSAVFVAQGGPRCVAIQYIEKQVPELGVSL